MKIPTDPGQVASVKRILNENAFNEEGWTTWLPGDTVQHPTGPVYDDDLVLKTDYMVASVLVNRVAIYGTNRWAFKYKTLEAAATGEANRDGGRIYAEALQSPYPSRPCKNLEMAINGLDQAMASPYPNIYWWKAVLQGKKPNTHLRPFRPDRDIRIGLTDFTKGLVE